MNIRLRFKGLVLLCIVGVRLFVLLKTLEKHNELACQDVFRLGCISGISQQDKYFTGSHVPSKNEVRGHGQLQIAVSFPSKLPLKHEISYYM